MNCPSCGVESSVGGTSCSSCGAVLVASPALSYAPPDEIGFSSGFVGRRRELGELSARLEMAFSGQGSLVLLVGEPGIGKTRTAQEFTNYAGQWGARVLWGRCYEEQGMPPYWPWIQAVRTYVREQAPEQLRLEMGTGAADIADIISDIHQRLPGLPQQPRMDNPEQARFRLFDSITSFLKLASQRQPIAIVLDDLHWADQSSLLLLQFLSREMAGSRLMLLGTYRDEKLSRQHPLSETLGDLTREQLFHRVLLRGLSQDDIGRFIEAIAGVTPSAQLVQTAHAQTEGNPLFVVEMVRLFVQEGRLDDPDRFDLRVPEGVREVIGRRLNRLSLECNDILTVAAVIGREFGLDQLKKVIQNTSEEKLLEVLESALAVQLIEEVPQLGERYQFTHALIQQTLASELSATRRIRLHARIADALEELYGTRAERNAAELAFHFSEAVTVTGTAKLIKYAAMAGAQALNTHAYDEALAYFQRAAAAKDEECLDDELAAIYLGLGRAQGATLDVVEASKVVDTLQRAYNYYVEACDLTKAAEAAAVPFHSLPGHRTGIAQLIGGAIARIPDGSPEQGRLLCRFIRVMAMEEGKYSESRDAFPRALEIAQRDGDKPLETRILVYSAEADLNYMCWTEALDKGKKAMELMADSRDIHTEVMARFFIATLSRDIGELRQALHYASTMLDCAERLRDRAWLAIAYYANETIQSFRGDWGAASGFSELGLASASMATLFLGRRAVMQGETGDLQNCRESLLHLEELLRGIPGWMALIHSHAASDIARVSRVTNITAFNGLARRSAEAVLSSTTATPVCASMSRSALALVELIEGRHEAALQHYAPLRITQGTMIHNVGVSGDRLLGLLANSDDRPEDAAGHFEAGLALCRKGGYQPELAWTLCDYASVMLTRQKSPTPTEDRRAKVKTLLQESLSISQSLGMKPLIDRIAGLLLEWDSLPTLVSAYPAGLSQREVEVLRLLALGKTNREIATELVISHNTVLRHVSNIMTKTGTSNRTEAAAYAVRIGLATD